MRQKMKKARSGSSGFSLVELLVVIAIVGIMAAIGVPAFLKTMPEVRLKNAARSVYADLQKARLLAVKENRDVRVRFNQNPDYYYYDDDNSGSYSPGEFRVDLSIYNGADFGAGNAATNWNGDAVSQASLMTFTKTGTALARSIYLENRNNNVCYAVTSTQYGAVKIRRYNGTSW